MARKKPNPEPVEDDNGPNLLIGYARVSTEGQSVDGQIAALMAAGVEEGNIFTDTISAAKKSRPGFNLAMKALRRGDTLVIYSLSRLGRDMVHLHEINQRLLKEGVNLKSLTEELDTRTAIGKFMVNALAMFAQFERDVTIERTRQGVKVHQAAGLPHGRPPKLTPGQMRQIERLLGGKQTIKQIAAKFGVSPATIKYHFRKPRIAYVTKK